ENFPGRHAAEAPSAVVNERKAAVETIAVPPIATEPVPAAPALPESAQHLAQRMTQTVMQSQANASAKFDLAALGD
ncbi:hypothetical protein ABTE74_23155, partial [Acinetobacter baumannii]